MLPPHSELFRIIITTIIFCIAVAFSFPANAQQFAPPVIFPFGLVTFNDLAASCMGDLDADGDLDLLVGDRGGTFHFIQNIGTANIANFTSPVANPFNLNTSFPFNAPQLVDLDNDGDLDLLSWAAEEFLIYYENSGTASTPIFNAGIQNPFSLNLDFLGGHSLQDLDADGDYDLVIGTGNSSFFYYENIGSPTEAQFQNGQLDAFGMQTLNTALSLPALFDLDLDGDFDLLFITDNGDYVYQQNIGTTEIPNFSPPILNPFGLSALINSPYWIAPCDLDGDGDVDLISGEFMNVLAYTELLSSVSYEEIIEEKAINTFPNPANSEIFIESTENIVSYELFDFTGKLIQQTSLINNSISVVRLPLGVYLLRLKTDKDEFFVKRFEKI